MEAEESHPLQPPPDTASNPEEPEPTSDSNPSVLAVIRNRLSVLVSRIHVQSRAALIGASGAVVAAVLVVILSSIPQDSAVKLVSLTLQDLDSQTTTITANLRNTGDKVAVLTKWQLKVERSWSVHWPLLTCPAAALSQQPTRFTDSTHKVEGQVQRTVPPNQARTLEITVGWLEDHEPRITILLLSLSLLSDEDSKSSNSQSFLVLWAPASGIQLYPLLSSLGGLFNKANELFFREISAIELTRNEMLTVFLGKSADPDSLPRVTGWLNPPADSYTPQLLQDLESDDRRVSVFACWGLSQLIQPSATEKVEAIVQRAHRGDAEFQLDVLSLLRSTIPYSVDAFGFLTTCLSSEDGKLRAFAGNIAKEVSFPPGIGARRLNELLAIRELRCQALVAMRKESVQPTLERLVQSLLDSDRTVSQEAAGLARNLLRDGWPDAARLLKALTEALQDAASAKRAFVAIELLGEASNPAVIEIVIRASTGVFARSSIKAVLNRLGPEPAGIQQLADIMTATGVKHSIRTLARDMLVDYGTQAREAIPAIVESGLLASSLEDSAGIFEKMGPPNNEGRVTLHKLLFTDSMRTRVMACYALAQVAGNADPEVSLLLDVMNDRSIHPRSRDTVVDAAMYALERLAPRAPDQARRVLEAYLRRRTDYRFQYIAIRIGNPMIPVLMETLRDPELDGGKASKARQILSQLDCVNDLIPILGASSGHFRSDVVRTLVLMKQRGKAAIPALRRLFSEDRIGKVAARAIASMGNEGVDSLLGASKDTIWVVRRNAAYGLGCLQKGTRTEDARMRLLKLAEDAKEEVRRVATASLERIK